MQYLTNDTRIGVGINRSPEINNSLVISGTANISDDLNILGNANLNTVNTNDLTISGALQIGSENVTSISLDLTEDVSVNSKLLIHTDDSTYTNSDNQTIHSDVNASGLFLTDISLNSNLIVSGKVLVLDGSNNNYGAYTLYTNQEGTTYFTTGKSPSNVFNIVNQNKTGVYMASGATTFTSTSDITLKTNISGLIDANEKLLHLNPITYKWKTQNEDDNKKQVGFIAQEVEEILPELVNANTYPDGSRYKGVATSNLVPYLIKSFQERSIELENLEQEYKNLTSK